MPNPSLSKDHHTYWSLALIAILVVLVRIVALQFDTSQDHVKFDVDDWLETARNLVAGEGYSASTLSYADEPRPTARRGPTVVFFFAAVISLFGDHVWSIIFAQFAAEVATSFILYFIALEIFRDRRVAFITSLLFAFYLPGLIFTFNAWSEPVFTLVLAGFTWGFLRALHQPSLWRFGLCGGLLGFTVLARPIMLFYPLMVLPLLWWALHRNWRRVLSSSVVLYVVFAAVLLPWVVRNYIVFGALIPGSTWSGPPFYEGNFALDQPDYLQHRGSEEAGVALLKALEARFGPAPRGANHRIYARDNGMNEVDFDNFAFKEGVKAVHSFPLRYVALSLVRFLRMWFHHRFISYLIAGGNLPNAWVVAAINAALLALAVAALTWLRGPWLPSSISLIVLTIYSSAVYAATNAVGRYSAPVMPYVMVFAAYTIVFLASKWRNRINTPRRSSDQRNYSTRF